MKNLKRKGLGKERELKISLQEAYMRFITERGGVMTIFQGATVVG